MSGAYIRTVRGCELRRRSSFRQGCARSGREPRRRSPSGGTTSSMRHDVHVPAFDIDALPVTNAQFLEFIDRRRLQPAAICGVTKAGSGFRRSEFNIQPSGCPRSTIDSDPRSSDLPSSLAVARACSKPLPLPPDWPVYVSHAEASAYARWKGRRLMTEAGVPSRRRRSRRRATSTSPASIRFRSARIRRPRALRASTICRQRLGVDVDGVRAVRRLRADALVPGVLRRLLRRPPLRHEGRVAGDGAAS